MSGPVPVVAAQRAAVRREVADLPDGALVLVACSGGQDSLALAAAVAFVAPRHGLRAGGVVVDHGLQTGSGAVASRAAEQCRALGLDPVEVLSVDVVTVAGPGAPGGGPEASARAARYGAIERCAQALGAGAVLLGHTLDDQAETVLLGLGRGSGARSLAGMPSRRGLLRRPFLSVRRTETMAACQALGLEPWHDPTNGPAARGPNAPEPALPLRSQVRNDVMPELERVLGPGVAEALGRSARQLRDDADLLDSLAAELLQAAMTQAPEGPDGPAVAALDVAVLAGAPAALRTRALRAALLGAGCPAGSLGRTHVEAVDALVLDWHGQGPVTAPAGVLVVRRYGRLLLLGGAGPPDPHDAGAPPRR